ncbi:MAG: hypothetical protein ACHQQ3_02835 [Gemmatimonadales bacterium]
MSLVIATIEVYSVPCDPATKATTGPGLEPFTTATRIDVAESLPAGTAMTPYARSPLEAEALPTVTR